MMRSPPSPHVRARLLESGGEELLERLTHLDGHRRPFAAETTSASAASGEAWLAAPDPAAATDFDVAIVGGGLWSILAPVLRARGVRVAVFDRARAGVTHREWNASGVELRALVAAGVVSTRELEALVVARYDYGVCRFHGGGTYPVRGVLDQAVDAGALLTSARARSESLGASFFDGHSLVAHAAGRSAVRLRFRDGGGAFREFTAKVMVDARGASSPYATADLVCPTVGGVIRGLDVGDAPNEVNPRVGEILATVDPVDDGRQYVWEAFPGRNGETTVYLFFYARSGESVSLSDLYERFFSSLHRYKRGPAELVRPTFGFIPGWSRLTPAPRSPDRRVVLVGDAAGRHSPLTYCGFGSTLRSLVPAAEGIVRLLDDDGLDLPSVVDDAPIHALTGLLAHMMAVRRFHGDELNTLLDAAFHSLHEMGNEPYARLLRDEMDPATFVSFLRTTAARHPSVWGKVLRGLGLGMMGRWSYGLAKAVIAGA